MHISRSSLALIAVLSAIAPASAAHAFDYAEHRYVGDTACAVVWKVYGPALRTAFGKAYSDATKDYLETRWLDNPCTITALEGGAWQAKSWDFETVFKRSHMPAWNISFGDVAALADHFEVDATDFDKDAAAVWRQLSLREIDSPWYASGYSSTSTVDGVAAKRTSFSPDKLQTLADYVIPWVARSQRRQMPDERRRADREKLIEALFLGTRLARDAHGATHRLECKRSEGQELAAFNAVPDYLALASSNEAHFAPQAWRVWRAGHRHALAAARAARKLIDTDPEMALRTLYYAAVSEALALHFLMDALASGHMRSPYVGFMHKKDLLFRHDFDNHAGLTVSATIQGHPTRWRAYGDACLLNDGASYHRHIVLLATASSLEQLARVALGEPVEEIAVSRPIPSLDPLENPSPPPLLTSPGSGIYLSGGTGAVVLGGDGQGSEAHLGLRAHSEIAMGKWRLSFGGFVAPRAVRAALVGVGLHRSRGTYMAAGILRPLTLSWTQNQGYAWSPELDVVVADWAIFPPLHLRLGVQFGFELPLDPDTDRGLHHMGGLTLDFAFSLPEAQS